MDDIRITAVVGGIGPDIVVVVCCAAIVCPRRGHIVDCETARNTLRCVRADFHRLANFCIGISAVSAASTQVVTPERPVRWADDWKLGRSEIRRRLYGTLNGASRVINLVDLSAALGGRESRARRKCAEFACRSWRRRRSGRRSGRRGWRHDARSLGTNAQHQIWTVAPVSVATTD